MTEQSHLDGRLCVVAGDDSAIADRLAGGLDEAGAVVARVPSARSRQEAELTLTDVRERLGAIEMLVCCPPAHSAAGVDELPPDVFEAAVAAGYKSPFLHTQAVLAEMRAGGFGRVVYVTSAAGILARAYTSHVASAARAAIALARTVAVEEGPAVTANAIAVGPLEGSVLLAARVRSLREIAGSSEAEARERIVGETPLGRLPQPDDVLEAVIAVLRPGSGFLTGQTIAVASGSELQIWP